MKTIIRTIVTLMLTIALASCGDTLGSNGTTSTGTTSSSSSGGSTGSTTTATTYTMTLATGLSSISTNGSTSVTATIKDSTGAVYTVQPVSVSFTSTCVGQNLATITPSPATAGAGVATATYTSKGCGGTTDTIAASATVTDSAGNTSNVSASANLTIVSPAVGSIQFVNANPPQLGLKGYGLDQASVVEFQVLDINGNPEANQVVDFALDSTTGGVSLTSTSATSDSNGYASVTVNSGTVATTIRVIATLASNTSITTESNPLVISTGIADQDSFSLSADDLNPEAWTLDGQTVTLTVHAADHFNNPVPAGSTVYFTAEGGYVQPSCTTTNGACTVTWTSDNPRPPDGRVTILATMKGEESFTDVNGTGVFESNDPFTDLGEAFRDDDEHCANENSESGCTYTAGVDGYYDDANNDGTWNAADGVYKGVLCSASAVSNGICDPSAPFDVRSQVVLVMAKSNLSVFVTNSQTTTPYTDPQVASITVPTAQTVWVSVCSLFLGTTTVIPGTSTPDIYQMPPDQTSINITMGAGKLLTNGSISVPSSNSQGCYETEVMVDTSKTAGNGLMDINVKTPSGVSSDTYIPVTDNG